MSTIAKKVATWIAGFFMLAFIGLFLVCVIAITSNDEDDEVTLTPAQQAAADSVRAVEDCLTLYSSSSTWFDTSLDEQIKARLNDPDSYEKRDVRLSAVGIRRVVTISFTAKNALGGTVRHTAKGTLDLDDCTAVLTEIE